jgi:hypothetical protein
MDYQRREEENAPRGQETVRVGGPTGQDTPPHGYSVPPANQTPTAYSAPPPPPAGPQASAYSKAPSSDRSRKQHGVPILGPVLLILAGVVFLLNNLDVLPWSIWGQLWRLWPLVLVAIGLDMLFGRRSPVLSALVVLGVLAAAGGWLFSTGSFEGWGRTVSVPFSVPLASAREASVEVDIGSGELRLGSMTSQTGLLAEGTVEVPENERQFEPEVDTEGDRVELRLEQPSGWSFPFSWGGSDMEVRLTRAVPMSLNLDVGSGNADLDLRELRVTDLEMDIGSGNTSATLPGAGVVDGKVDVGSGNLTLNIPSGVYAEIEASIGSGNVEADSAFRREGDRYILGTRSGDNSNSITLDVHVGSGNVNLQAQEKLP